MKTKLTTKETKIYKDFLKEKLSTNKAWTLRALEVIAMNQTDDEFASEYTQDRNNLGFTGVDGDILTSIYKFYKSRGFVSPKQLKVIFKKMPKYWKQVLDVSDLEKLNTEMVKEKINLL